MKGTSVPKSWQDITRKHNWQGIGFLSKFPFAIVPFSLYKQVLYNYLYDVLLKPCSWSADKIFEVRHASHVGDKFVVNIDETSCTCRKWSITGIPCYHALEAMRFLNNKWRRFHLQLVQEVHVWKNICIHHIPNQWPKGVGGYTLSRYFASSEKSIAR